MDAHEILKKPYARMVMPDADGSFFSEIVEFPGCFASGKTAVDALQNLEGVAVDWINAALAQGQDIPAPMDSNEYSGKTVLRMTKGLHRRAALWAEREGTSLNQFINTCVAEAVGERARAVIYPVAQVQTITAFRAVPPLTVSVTGAFVGLANDPYSRLSTGTGVGFVPAWSERERQRA
jgi:antitoxin HicB